MDSQNTLMTPPPPQNNPQITMDASDFLKNLISNSHIPEPVAGQFWVCFGLSPKLTFLSETDYKKNMLLFQIKRNTFIKSIPKKDYDSKMKNMLLDVEIEFGFNLKRSMGNGRMNERELQASSTTAVFQERPLGDNKPQNRGIISSVLGIFGGRKE